MAACIDDIDGKLALSHDCQLALQNGGMINDPPPTTRHHTSNHPDARRFFVSRHPGAIQWAKRYHWAVRTQFVEHLDIADIMAGDIVIGTLPVHLAAEVCARGARYLHLSIPLSAGQRGMELDAEDLEESGALLVPCRVMIGW